MDKQEEIIIQLRAIVEMLDRIYKVTLCPEILDTSQTAELLRTSGSRIDEMRRSETIHATKMGKGYLFNKDEVVNFAKERIKDEL